MTIQETGSPQQLTQEWNGVLADLRQNRRENVSAACKQYSASGKDAEAAFLNWFLAKDLATRQSKVEVTPFDPESPIDNQHAWKELRQDDLRPYGAGRRTDPNYYTSAHVEVKDGDQTIYDQISLLADHANIRVRQEVSGTEQVWPTSGVAISVYDKERHAVLVRVVPTANANPMVDVIAFSTANLKNMQAAAQDSTGLAKLGKETVAIMSIVTGKDKPQLDDLLQHVWLLDNPCSGDANKMTMPVAQAYMEVDSTKSDALATAIGGMWVNPDILPKMKHLGILTNHASEASGNIQAVTAGDAMLWRALVQ